MLARDIMTRNVVTAAPETEVAEIARRLLQGRISAVPIVENGKLVGIVSEGDLLRRAELGAEPHPARWAALFLEPADRAARYVKSHGRYAKDVMTRDVVTVDEDTELAEIAELLERERIKRVPVLRGGELVGIVSRANLLHGWAAIGPSQQAAADDEALRAQILARLEEDAGVDAGSLNVVVAHGVAHLWGAVGSEAERRAAAVSAENTPGVREVVDHLGILAPTLRSTGI